MMFPAQCAKCMAPVGMHIDVDRFPQAIFFCGRCMAQMYMPARIAK